jgi:hypothetical protein
VAPPDRIPHDAKPVKLPVHGLEPQKRFGALACYGNVSKEDVSGQSNCSTRIEIRADIGCSNPCVCVGRGGGSKALLSTKNHAPRNQLKTNDKLVPNICR